MADQRREVGGIGETLAADFLKKKGYNIVARNYRRSWGEIDVIALKDNIVHFVEVKAVSRETLEDFSREMDYRPEELVHRNKLKKIARTAESFMSETKDNREFQIDVVGVILSRKDRTARCRLFEQVVEGDLS